MVEAGPTGCPTPRRDGNPGVDFDTHDLEISVWSQASSIPKGDAFIAACGAHDLRKGVPERDAVYGSNCVQGAASLLQLIGIVHNDVGGLGVP